MTAYADVADLEAFLGRAVPGETPPDSAQRMLERASELLDSIVVRPFAVDAVSGLPEDEDVGATLRAACCAQVEAWLEVGEMNDVDGLAGTQVSVGSYSGTRAPVVAPRALRILKNAALMVSA